MKKKKLAVGALIGTAIAGLTLGGCAGMHPQTVYGPPPDLTTAETGETDPSASGALEPEEPDTFDPSSMIVEDVYGPPEFFEDGPGE